jgi:protoheme IX farnesyltransferase
MPHSFAIAMYRLHDYERAKIPVLPLIRGVNATKIQILMYTISFVVVSELLYVYGYVGAMYAVIMGTFGVAWICITALGVFSNNGKDTKWSKKVFLFSIAILLAWSVAIMVERLLAL